MAKNFKLIKDAQLIFYNLNAIENETSVVIVEGEIDCLSMHEAGVHNSISVPNGASKGSQKLEYLDNCWQAFEGIEKIILAVDNDEAGNSLREELARRLGKERCWLVTYPEGCKDANEVLVRSGKEAVLKLVSSARQYPLEGVLTVEDMAETVQSYYEKGYPAGASCGVDGFSKENPIRKEQGWLTFIPGQLTMITGIPGHGKDEFTNEVTVGLAVNEDWKFGIIGFEEEPPITVTKLMEKYTRLAFDFRQNPHHRMNQKQFEQAALFVNDYYKFVNTDEVEITVDAMIEKIDQMVIRWGINGVVISPWNCFDHNLKQGENETLYVSNVLGRLIKCLKRNSIHGFLLAHPTKIQKDKATGKYEVPTLYSISGSANFFNKTHNGITVYRDYETNIADIHIQKVKHSWLGKIGMCSFRYDTMTRQYFPLDTF